MEYRNLGRSALRVSRIGLGGVTFGRETDAETSFAIMDRALECGITLLDTAEAYAAGRSEEVVGQWMADRRSRQQIVLATKVTPPLRRDRILSSAEASLRRLRTDHVDLFQLHAWDNATPLDETLEALEALVQAGKARVVGCSNLAAWQLCKALWRQDAHGWARMESVQPNYNLLVRDIEREMLPLCADQEIGVLSYSPLGGGFFTGKYVQGEPVPKGLSPGHRARHAADLPARLRLSGVGGVAGPGRGIGRLEDLLGARLGSESSQYHLDPDRCALGRACGSGHRRAGDGHVAGVAGQPERVVGGHAVPTAISDSEILVTVRQSGRF